MHLLMRARGYRVLGLWPELGADPGESPPTSRPSREVPAIGPAAGRPRGSWVSPAAGRTLGHGGGTGHTADMADRSTLPWWRLNDDGSAVCEIGNGATLKAQLCGVWVELLPSVITRLGKRQRRNQALGPCTHGRPGSSPWLSETLGARTSRCKFSPFLSHSNSAFQIRKISPQRNKAKFTSVKIL